MAFLARTDRAPEAQPAAMEAAGPPRRMVLAAFGAAGEVQYVAPGGDAQAGEFERRVADRLSAIEAGRDNAALARMGDALGFMTQGLFRPPPEERTALMKPYAADQAALLAREMGLGAARVAIGRCWRSFQVPPGSPAWRVPWADPRSPGPAAGWLSVHGDKGAATRDAARLIDPRSGHAVANGTRQATVVAGSALQAAVLATAAVILGVPRALEFLQSNPGTEGLLVTEQAKAQTRGFFAYFAETSP